LEAELSPKKIIRNSIVIITNPKNILLRENPRTEFCITKSNPLQINYLKFSKTNLPSAKATTPSHLA